MRILVRENWFLYEYELLLRISLLCCITLIIMSAQVNHVCVCVWFVNGYLLALSAPTKLGLVSRHPKFQFAIVKIYFCFFNDWI